MYIYLIVSICIILVFIYITILTKKNNRKIYNIAYIDSVTELGNNNLFKQQGSLYLKNNLSSVNKYIVTIDINKFNALNNIYGYNFCNKILKNLGQEIKKMLPPKNITCRINNDTFSSIFNYDGDISELLDKISNDASNIEVDGKNIQLNLTIGAYNILPNEEDINKILNKSYLAHTEIKGNYSSNYYLFDEKLENRLIEEQKIEASMKDGLKNEEFKVIYQPKIFAENEKIAGAEALVRWNRNGEMVPPNKFIPLFEKNKFIVKLDIYIFEKVCKDLAEWKKKFGGIPLVSINVSKEHFLNENFINEYEEICNKYGIKPNEVELEITESATIDEDIDILNILKKIKEKGFIISLDDFGTGYSSLSMLQIMPIDVIKVAKIFVDKADLEKDNNIINYIVIIAKQLGVKTTVEGVETKEQADFIRKIHGDIIQGYYYSKPLPKDEFEEYFSNMQK